MLFEIVEALRTLRFASPLVERREQHGRQNGNNSNYNKEFN